MFLLDTFTKNEVNLFRIIAWNKMSSLFCELKKRKIRGNIQKIILSGLNVGLNVALCSFCVYYTYFC